MPSGDLLTRPATPNTAASVQSRTSPVIVARRFRLIEHTFDLESFRAVRCLVFHVIAHSAAKHCNPEGGEK